MDPAFSAFVESCTSALPGRLQSISYYPHPFTNGGFVVIMEKEVTGFFETASHVYAAVPSGYSLHMLRASEIDMLTAPGIFVPPLQINEKPHLPYYLKYKGENLYGRNFYDEVTLPDTTHLLASHIEGCYDYLRRYGILSFIIHQKFMQLGSLLDRESLLLMATAVLTKGYWEIDLSSIENLFFAIFDAPGLVEVYARFKENNAYASGVANRATITGKVWLFETFLRELRRVA